MSNEYNRGNSFGQSPYGSGNSYNPNVPFGASPSGNSYDPNVPFGANPAGNSAPPRSSGKKGTVARRNGTYTNVRTDIDIDGAKVIPFTTSYRRKYNAITAVLSLIVIAGIVIGPMYLTTVPPESLPFTGEQIVLGAFFIAVTLLTIVDMIIVPVLRFRYIKSVCTYSDTGIFVDYEVHKISSGRSGHHHQTTAYYPRYLVNCNGKRQIRTLLDYRLIPKDNEPDAELHFNPDGPEMYIVNDRGVRKERIARAIVGLIVFAIVLSVVGPTLITLVTSIFGK